MHHPHVQMPVLLTRLPPQYFSTLERLRLTQHPNVTLDSSQTTNDFYDFSSTPLKLRKSRRGRAASDLKSGQPVPQRSTPRSRTLSVDSAIENHSQQTRPTSEEERFDLHRNKTLSVIADTTDGTSTVIAESSSLSTQDTQDGIIRDQDGLEAIDRPDLASSRSRSPTHEHRATDDMAAAHSRMVPDSFYESFRCLDESNDLDLQLRLDNYNSSSAATSPPPRNQGHVRHVDHVPTLVDDKSCNPPTPDMADAHHARSLRTPRPSLADNVVIPSTNAVDLAAAHYQDPEARLKLRVYLASPQKFDEAHHTFLADDKSSVYSDDASMAEPDSPKTPEPLEKPSAARPFRAASDAGLLAKAAVDYNQAAASAREMTLRMTLTRPDLRAGEDQIYGWQHKGIAAGRKSQSVLREEVTPTVVYIREGNSKDSIERQFAVMDQWAEPERGVVKRFWNRVRRQ
ncbi:unnamed protein product [Parascedosporium putredinis]|uniref:Mucin n=1 Tax=Parascedosporium putredinis TaxID=1442378 RepID=A0A9P1H7G5_9PEZI|nr:unnamed protein product [Parascedosporium putredinis]CAI7998410.1 unnamed protein product [Parascedosporium putredinis]